MVSGGTPSPSIRGSVCAILPFNDSTDWNPVVLKTVSCKLDGPLIWIDKAMAWVPRDHR